MDVVGAASLTSLLSVSGPLPCILLILTRSVLILSLQSIAPRVLMVEEAGQVLEAHILSSLVLSGG